MSPVPNNQAKNNTFRATRGFTNRYNHPVLPEAPPPKSEPSKDEKFEKK